MPRFLQGRWPQTLSTVLLAASGALNAQVPTFTEGVDRYVLTSCTPPTTRTDGTPLQPGELTLTRVHFSQSSDMSGIVHTIIASDLNCNTSLDLTLLPAFGTWYKGAQAKDQRQWSDLRETKEFVYLAAPSIPTDPEIDRKYWSVKYVSSEELVNWFMPATYLYDGDRNKLWHSQYQGAEPDHPHSFHIDMGMTHRVSGFRQQPREGGGNGTIRGYVFYTSTDGVNWSERARGEHPAGDATHTVTFAPVDARYFRYDTLSEQDGGKQAAIAEFWVVGTDAALPAAPNPPTMTE